MVLNVNQLRSFYAAAKNGSITKAAAELMVTPAAVTLQVKQLEENIGLKLLYRSGNSMLLTESGLEVFGRIRTFFDEIQNLEVFIADISKGKSGELKIGCSETAAIYVMPGLISSFQLAYPGIKIVIGRGTTDEMLNSLVNRQIELVVAHYRPEDKRFKMRFMGSKIITLIAAKNSTYLPQEAVGINSLKEVPFIAPAKGSAIRHIMSNYLKQFKVFPKIVMETSSIALTKTLVQQDKGFSFVCREGINEEISKGQLKEVQVLEGLPAIEYGVGYLNRNDLSEAALAFIKIMEQSKHEQGARG
ncbi:MAG: LysR family transcriptional regulator [Syntrophobacteraceae bacterium]|nr:LysR family transcriptional regulator [Syntrophobacteraceae bacterium]